MGGRGRLELVEPDLIDPRGRVVADCDDSWYPDAHNPEQMFHINASKSSHKYNYLNMYCGLRTFDSGDYKPVFPMDRGYGFGTVNPDLWENWDPADIRRYGKAYCIAALESQLGRKIWNNGVETEMKDQGPGYRKRYEDTYGFRPYPQTEISLSNGVLKQKDGWDASSALFTSWK